MKKVLVLALGVVFFISCDSTPKGFSLNGTVTGDLDNGTQIFLKTTDSLNQLVEIDTTTVENGLFNFEGVQTEPKLHYIFIESGRGSVPVVLENGDIKVEFQKDSMNFAKLKGTPQNDLFMDFLDESRKLNQRAISMQKDMRTASMERDTATATALREEYIELQDEANKFNINYAKQNPDALISVLIIGSLMSSKAIPNEEIKEMFDGLTPEMKASEPGETLKKRLEEIKSTDIGAIGS